MLLVHQAQTDRVKDVRLTASHNITFITVAGQ
jgi:hypothetical protein